MIQGRSNAWAVGTTIIEANKRLGYPSRESVSAHCIQTGPIGHRSRAQARHCVRAPARSAPYCPTSRTMPSDVLGGCGIGQDVLGTDILGGNVVIRKYSAARRLVLRNTHGVDHP